MHADFEHYGQAAALATACLYGGSPYQPQEGALRRGLDVVVGTPGRVKDHLERGTLRLHKLQCAPARVMLMIASRGLLLGACGCVSAAGPQSAVFL